MIEAKELYAVAEQAVGEAMSVVAELLCQEPENPTPEEGAACCQVFILVIAQIEARVKAYLPPEKRESVRAFIDQLSAKVSAAIVKSEKKVDKPPRGGIIQPDFNNGKQ